MKGWLGEKRIREILSADTFVCHKTTGGKIEDRLQCAGHMLLKGEENVFVRTANSMGIDLELSGRDEVFDTEEDCIRGIKDD